MSGVLDAIFGAGGTAAAVIQGERQARAQKRALKMQAEAQARAESAAIRQQRENEMANNKANAKQPDIAAILAGEQAKASRQLSTMLTGPSGVDQSSLKLGRTTLLGE